MAASSCAASSMTSRDVAARKVITWTVTGPNVKVSSIILLRHKLFNIIRCHAMAHMWIKKVTPLGYFGCFQINQD